MRRFVPALALLVLAVPARGQTAAELAKTAALIESWQNSDGGFGAAKGAKSSLGATSSAVRMLRNVGGTVPDLAGCRDYVKSCFDPRSGGFTNEPGGATGVGLTASGLMAVAALGTTTDAMVDGAIAYFHENAKSFEDVRIAVAGFEAVKKTSPDFPRWTAQINADRNPDGTWGQGGEKAFATGSRVAALLRMGASIDKKDAVAAAMKAGQRPDGGWSKDGAESDLGATYRIMRSLFMMKEKPDLKSLRSYLESHRREGGGFSMKPGGNDVGGTYYVTTVGRWVRILSGEPDAAASADFTPLFDGKTLDGWEGDLSLWSAKDGMLVGTSPGLKHNDFLATKKSYGDFVLKLSFRITGDPNANSGVQFRSVRVPGGEMSGYQADIGQGFWGCLYDESRRNKVLVEASDKAKSAIHREGWNEYVIRCEGDRITLTLNGQTSVDYTEKAEGIARDGKIAVQIHAGGPMKVEFKDVLIRPLPGPKAENAAAPGLPIALTAVPVALVQEPRPTDRPASRSKLIDEAGLFSKAAVEEVTRRLEEIERESSVPVVIETVESLKGEPIEAATLKAARVSGGAGLFVLIAKEEKSLRLVVRRQFEHRTPEAAREAIRDAFLAGFKAGRPDDGLSRGVAEIAEVLKRTQPAIKDGAADANAGPLVVRDRVRLTLAGARRALAASEAKAAQMNLKMNIAIVDDGGHLLVFARMDGARPASAATAQTKAVSAATLRQATGPIPPGADSPDLIVNLGLAAAAASGGAKITTLYGGVPIVIDGQVVGAIGVGGGTGHQDAEVATAGVAALAEESRTPVEK